MHQYFRMILVVLVYLVLTPEFSFAQERHMLQVQGGCSMCSDRITLASKKMKGVILAQYTLDSKTLEVLTIPNFSLDELAKEIAEVGHDNEKHLAPDSVYAALPECCHYRNMPSNTVSHEEAHHDHEHPIMDLLVHGNCGMCKTRIEEAALNVSGVRKADWDADKKILSIEIEPAGFNPLTVHQAMVAIGHDTDLLLAKRDVYENLHSCCKYRDEGKILTGMIYEPSKGKEKTPLIGAVLRWAGETEGTSTDLNGGFLLPMSGKNQKLVISYVGMKDDTVLIKKPGFVELTVDPNYTLQTVEIRNRRKTIEVSYVSPIKVKNISEKELMKAACCNLSESFETNPAVDVSFSDAVTGTRTIEMLGLAGPYVQITRENMPDIRGLAAISGFTYTPGPWIESIQLNLGTGSVVNGFESIAGQINVELKKPWDDEALYINGYLNQNGRAEANLVANTPVSDKWDTGIMLHYNQRKRKLDHHGDGFLDMPLGEMFIVGNNWKYQGDRGQEAQIGVKYTNSTTTSGQTIFDPEIANDAWGMQMDVNRIEVNVKRGQVLLDKENASFGIQLGGLYHDQKSKFGRRDYNGTQKMLYINGIFHSYLAGKAHQINTGVSLQAESFDETLGQTSFVRDEVVPGIFGEYTYLIDEKFTAVAGIRLDHHNLFGLFATPRLHLRYALGQYDVMRASIGRGQRTANVIAENLGMLSSSREIVFDVDTENGLPYGLNQEVAWSYGLNYQKDFRIGIREFTWSVDLYHTRFAKQVILDYDQNPQAVHIYNLPGTSFSNSFQSQLDFNPIDHLDIRLAYRFNDVQVDLQQGRVEKPLVSKHRAFANIAYELPANGWKFDYTINWQGSRRLPFTGTNPVQFRLEDRSPSFFVHNAQISKIWANTMEWYVGVENLLNFTQDDPILSSRDPWSPYFDASLVWGPINERMVYIGFRYKIFRNQE